MRLYLSSYQLGNAPDRFAELVGGERQGWLVMNAVDGLDDQRRARDASTQISHLADLGLRARDLDLRTITPQTVDEEVGQPDFVWIRGGNVFTLRMALARSGMDRWIVDNLAADRFVHAGFSAGVCVLAPSLRGLEVCDPIDDVQQRYGEVRFDGLGVLDRPVVPHLDTPEHPESDVLGRVAARYRAEGQQIWGLRDGEALVCDGDPHTDLELVG